MKYGIGMELRIIYSFIGIKKQYSRNKKIDQRKLIYKKLRIHNIINKNKWIDIKLYLFKVVKNNKCI